MKDTDKSYIKAVEDCMEALANLGGSNYNRAIKNALYGVKEAYTSKYIQPFQYTFDSKAEYEEFQNWLLYKRSSQYADQDFKLELGLPTTFRHILKDITGKMTLGTFSHPCFVEKQVEKGIDRLLEALPHWKPDYPLISPNTMVIGDSLYYEGYHIPLEDLKKLPKED